MAMEFQSLMVKLGINIQDYEKGLATASGKIDAFGKSVSGALSGISSKLAVFGTATTASVGLAVKSFASLQSAMTGVMTQFHEDATSMIEIEKELTDTTVNLAKEFGISAVDLAGSLETIVNAFEDVDDAKAVYRASTELSVAANMNMAQSADNVITIMKNYGSSFKNARDAAELLYYAQEKTRGGADSFSQSIRAILPAASQLGVDIEELLSVLPSMSNSMGGASQAAMGLKAIFAALASGTAEVNELTQKYLGVNADVAVSQKGLMGVLHGLSQARAEELNLVFPSIRALAGLGGALKDVATYEKALQGIKERGGALDEALMKRQKDVEFQFRRMREAVADLWREYGEALVPTVEKAIKWAEGHIKTIKEWVTANKEQVQSIAEWVAILGAVAIPAAAVLKVVADMTIAFTGLAKASIYLASKLPMLIAFFGNPAVLAILAVSAAVGALAYQLNELDNANKAAMDSQREFVQMNIDIQSELAKGIDKTKESYKNLTFEEQANLDLLKMELTALQLHSIAVQADLEATDAEREAIAKQTLEIRNRIKAYEDDVAVASARREEQDIELERQYEQNELYQIYLKTIKNSVEQKQKEAEAIAQAQEALGLLNGTIIEADEDNVEYAKSVKEVSNKLKEAGVEAGKVAKVISDAVDEGAYTVDITVTGVETLEDIEKRIKGLNDEIVLAKLEGDAQQIESTRQRAEAELTAVTESITEQMTAHEEMQATLAEQHEANVEDLRQKFAEIPDVLAIEMEKENKRYMESSEQIKTVLQDKINAYKEEAKALTELAVLATRGADAEAEMNRKILEEKQKFDEEVQKIEKEAKAREEQRFVDQMEEQRKQSAERLKIQKENMTEEEKIHQQMQKDKIAAMIAEYETAHKVGKERIKIMNALARATAEANRVAKEESTSTSSTEVPGKVDVSTPVPQGSLQVGSSFVPRTGSYQLHKGEGVIQAGQADNPMVQGSALASRMGALSGGGGITIVNKIDSGFINEAIKENPDEVVNVIGRDLVRRGKTSRAVKFVGGF